MIHILLLLLALIAPPDPHLTAYWVGLGAAELTWSQTARGCLYRQSAIGEHIFIGCYERYPATIRIELGGPATDGNYRPTVGDVYVLQTAGQTYRALLAGRPVYLPAFRA